MSYVLEVKDLVKKFKDKTAVNNISFSIKEGEVYGLLGPNGAGKSTTINLITELLKKDNGKILINGNDIENETEEAKRLVGFVPQDLAIYYELSAADNLKFFASLYGIRGKELKDRLDEVIHLVGLNGREGEKAMNYSGGMRRRLNIACALMHKPKLLIMDEPTVGIDPQSRNNILTSIRHLNKQNMSILYTTHYMEEAESLCDRVGIMDRGKIIAEGSVSELEKLVTDSNKVSLELINPQEFNANMLSSINGIKKINLEGKNLEIETIKDVSIIAAILNNLKERNIPVTNLITKGSNLEDVFLSLTGTKLRD